MARLGIPKLRRHGRRAYAKFNGVRRYFGRWGTTAAREAFEQALAGWLEGGKQGVPLSALEGQAASQEPISLARLMGKYLDFAEVYYRDLEGNPTPGFTQLRVLFREMLDLYPDLLARDFGPLRLKALREKLVGRGNCRRQVNDQVARVKRAFRWAVEEELVPPAVWQALSAVAGLRRGKTEARESEHIPEQCDHRFRRNLITRSGFI